MPWWSWILIWVVLALVLLLVLVLGAIHLFRRGSALMKEVGSASEDISRALDDHAQPVRAPEAARGTVPVGWDAAFGDPALVRQAREADKELRVEARRERRIASLHAHGRPRRWSDLSEETRSGRPAESKLDETR